MERVICLSMAEDFKPPQGELSNGAGVVAPGNGVVFLF